LAPTPQNSLTGPLECTLEGTPEIRRSRLVENFGPRRHTKLNDLPFSSSATPVLPRHHGHLDDAMPLSFFVLSFICFREYNFGAVRRGIFSTHSRDPKIGESRGHRPSPCFIAWIFFKTALEKALQLLTSYVPASPLTPRFLRSFLACCSAFSGAALGGPALGFSLMDGALCNPRLCRQSSHLHRGQIRVCVHAVHFRPQAIEFHSRFVTGVSVCKSFMQCRERCASP